MIGYFLTGSTYGTWLHGDVRGSYNNKGEYVPPNELLHRYRQNQLNEEPFYFSPQMCLVVYKSFEEWAQRKSWFIYRMTVQPRHVHIAVKANGEPDGKKVLQSFKSHATMRLRQAKLIAPDCSPWAIGGNALHIYNSKQLEEICEYIAGHPQIMDNPHP